MRRAARRSADDLYDDWLGMWDQAAAEKQSARKVTHEEEIQWVETVQDYKVGLLIAPELGFRTWGTESLIAEIPPGCHTGKHKHGEESIHIVQGSGFSVISDVRYDWKKGSTLVVPYGAEHQHFNTGETTARYFSAMSVHLEHFCGLHRHTQLQERGRITHLPNVPSSPTNFDVQGRRIHLPLAEAPVRIGGESAEGSVPVIETSARIATASRPSKPRSAASCAIRRTSTAARMPTWRRICMCSKDPGTAWSTAKASRGRLAPRSTCRVRRPCINTSTMAIHR